LLQHAASVVKYQQTDIIVNVSNVWSRCFWRTYR